nr:DUF1772 domain-containing protein [Streptomyces sp. CT34]
MEATLRVLALVGTGIVAGVLFAVAISVMPALIAMTPDRYVVTHKLLGRRYDRIMPFIVSGSALIDLVSSVRSSGTPRVVFAAAAVCLVGVAVVSQSKNVPINRRVKQTDPKDLGPDWQDPRIQWRNWHLMRTCFAVIGCILTAIAVVVS